MMQLVSETATDEADLKATRGYQVDGCKYDCELFEVGAEVASTSEKDLQPTSDLQTKVTGEEEQLVPEPATAEADLKGEIYEDEAMNTKVMNEANPKTKELASETATRTERLIPGFEH